VNFRRGSEAARRARHSASAPPQTPPTAIDGTGADPRSRGTARGGAAAGSAARPERAGLQPLRPKRCSDGARERARPQRRRAAPCCADPRHSASRHSASRHRLRPARWLSALRVPQMSGVPTLQLDSLGSKARRPGPTPLRRRCRACRPPASRLRRGCSFGSGGSGGSSSGGSSSGGSSSGSSGGSSSGGGDVSPPLQRAEPGARRRPQRRQR
jgi:uncharacterized membrane protein YgcG